MSVPDPLAPMDFDEEARPHRPADDREEVYFQGPPLLRAQVGAVALWNLGALAVLSSLFIYRVSQNTWPPVLFIAIVVFVAAMLPLVPVILTKNIRYRISNYRIDYESGIMSKNIDTLELWHVEDLKFHQGPLDRLLKVGRITIFSHDESTPVLVLEGLYNPRPLFETLKQRIIAVKRQRGVIKMDIG